MCVCDVHICVRSEGPVVTSVHKDTQQHFYPLFCMPVREEHGSGLSCEDGAVKDVWICGRK